jgi:hypothetical protein
MDPLIAKIVLRLRVGVEQCPGSVGNGKIAIADVES